MQTAANVYKAESAHYYDPKTGAPCHEVPNKSKGGMRPTTVADCRKMGLVPSVTTILQVLRKPALERWIVEQSVLAVVSAPDLPGEALDAKIDRVLNQERQQDQEAQQARDLGTRIHDAIASALTGADVFDSFWGFQDTWPYIEAPLQELKKQGRLIFAENVLVGDGYAGKADAAFESDIISLIDAKTTKSTLPTKSYPEHRLQLAAYAKALGNTGDKRIQTANLYISTAEPGKLSLCVNTSWDQDYEAFAHLLAYWRIVNGMNDL